ncbi:MAG: hypothetical protein ACRDOK_09165 [Streptosporangiaceae bacterium]
MTTTTTGDQLERVPITELATRPDPADWHAALRALGTHARGGQWIVSTPPDVAAALIAPGLRVIPPPAGGGPAADLVARMARFCDGKEHRRRRALTVRLLPPVAEVAGQAARRTARYLLERAAADVLDVMPLARTVPAGALARTMGLSGPHAASAANLTGRLSDALLFAPPGPVPAQACDADEAASQLCAALGPLELTGEDGVAAAASVLFQARDATAALIGAAVLAAPRGESGQADRVEAVLRRHAPVQCTRRVAVADTTIGAAVIPRGSDVWIFVAAAEPGSGIPASFGSGPHACPAAATASAIARAVVTVLEAGGWRPVAGQRIDYEPRPSLRLPCHVLVSRG